mgnify:CR=1 FL=1
MKKCLYIILLLLPCTLLAQETFPIKGIIFNSKNKQRVEKAKITNIKSGNAALSDTWGLFSLEVAVGDTLLVEKENFSETQHVILKQQNLVIYLQPSISLDVVTVKGQTKQAEQQEILEGYRDKGVFYGGYPPFLAYIFTPLSALHELLGKDAKNARNFAAYAARENAQSAVDRVFNKSLIMQHSDIEEKDVAEFMFYYRPKPEDISRWNDYDKIKYIQESYKAFKAKR